VRECTFRPNVKTSEHTFNKLVSKPHSKPKKAALANMKNFLKRLNQAEERKKEHVESILKQYESSSFPQNQESRVQEAYNSKENQSQQ
jgi:hypothetical protein